MSRRGKGAAVAAALFVVVGILMGASFVVSQRMQQDAAATGNSTNNYSAPGSILDHPQKPTQSQPPLVGSNVPPAGPGPTTGQSQPGAR
jgi:hypothetical protein